MRHYYGTIGGHGLEVFASRRDRDAWAEEPFHSPITRGDARRVVVESGGWVTLHGDVTPPDLGVHMIVSRKR